MSLSDITRNSFQSGITAAKWGSLCKLFVSKQSHRAVEDIQTDINSVLILFRDYPGDPALQGYLKFSIRNGLLSLPTFVTTFLSAARSPDLHHPATLDMLCRVALDSHYGSRMPATGSIVPYSESTIEVLGTVQDAMSLLRLAHSLPTSHFHQFTESASQLLVLLLSTVSDMSQISTAQAMVHFADASDMLQVLRLSPRVRQVLESFALSLSLLLGDDAKAAREAQMMHTLQLALGKGDILGSNLDTDITTCSLVLHSLVFTRANEFGAGDGGHVIAVFIALLRWSSWTRVVFCTQLLLSALTCVAQNSAAVGSTRSALTWRAFVIGRLPSLLVAFRNAAELEGGTEVDWHTALQIALAQVLQRTDLLDQCDNNLQSMNSEGGSDRPVSTRSFVAELLYQLLAVGLVDPSFVATMNPTPVNEFRPRLASEAQDAGMELVTYFESRLSMDISLEDFTSLIQRTWHEPCSHAAFAEAVGKRFAQAHSHDVESLGHICKVLCQCESALDIVSLHLSIPALVAHALAFVEGYDCETVGDPQTAVSHFGDIVIFLQSTIARFNLLCPTFSSGAKNYGVAFLYSAATVHTVSQLRGDDVVAFHAWFKALFDSNEGIEDTILRNTRPKTLLRIAATLFSHAISQCAGREIERDVLNNGISYFLDPLLNWTLAGVVKALASEIQHRGYNAPIYLEVLQTILLSSSCPQAVLCLSASTILRLFPDLKKFENGRLGSFDLPSVRNAALHALGLPIKVAANPQNQQSSNSQSSHWTNQPRQAIRDALSAVRAGKGPSLDVDRCLLLTSPTKFLDMLWRELIVAATMGDMDATRRIATFVLTMPRCARWPPLLPLFIHTILPGLVATTEHLTPADQAVSVEMLVAIISSALTFALHMEWALITACGDQRPVLGPPATTMARRLASDLRRRGHGPTSDVIVQRLASSAPFMANFPTFVADL